MEYDDYFCNACDKMAHYAKVQWQNDQFKMQILMMLIILSGVFYSQAICHEHIILSVAWTHKKGSNPSIR